MTGQVRQPGSDTPTPAGRKLNSWKEIAAYLNVSVSTVIRWEKNEGLPVRRHRHDKLSSLYAFQSELDRWREARSLVSPPSRLSCWQMPLQIPDEPSIAVLPFLNLSHDEEDEVLCDGLSDELITALSQIEGLRVVARTSCFYFKNKPVDIRQVAHALGVRTVLEGSLRRSGKRVRVAAQLIRAEDGFHIGSYQFDREMEDLLDIQEEISKSIVRALQGKLADDRQLRLLSRYTRYPAACKLYLQGRYYLNHMVPGWPQAAIRCFEQSLEIEPKLAPALTGLADSYSKLVMLGLLPVVDAMETARRVALRALQIDDRLADAHVSLGLLLAADYDWPGAEAEFLKALALDPDNAMAHLFYAGGVLVSQGRLEEEHFHQVQAYNSDPVNPSVAVGFAADMLFFRRYEQSIEACRKALRLEPGFSLAYRWMGEAFLLLGKFEDAISVLANVPMPSLAAGYLGYCHARVGRVDEARAVAAQLESLPGNLPRPVYQIAILQLGLGEEDVVFASLTQACEARSFGITWLGIDPIWDPIRDDRRFASLLERMNLGAGRQQLV